VADGCGEEVGRGSSCGGGTSGLGRPSRAVTKASRRGTGDDGEEKLSFKARGGQWRISYYILVPVVPVLLGLRADV
jgi:hypothetical protein